MNKTLLSILFTILLIIWLASGVVGDSAAVDHTQSETSTFSVRVINSEQQNHQLMVELRGRIDANKEVLVAAKIQGEVVATPNPEGSHVKAGDVLCQIETADRLDQMERAEAAVRVAELEYQGVKRLATGGLQSDLSVASAENTLAAARLAARQAELAVSYLNITAPFDGVVEQLLTEQGSYIKSGMACARLLDVTPMIFTGQVSESQVRHIMAGRAGRLEVAGLEALPSTVRFVSSQADTVTRNYTVEAVFETPERLPAGLTAKMSLDLGESPAHLLPPSTLGLSTNGILRVKIVNTQSRVEYVPVQVIDETTEGIWLTGLPERALVIAVGGEFVAEGDRVSTVVVGE